MGGARGRRAAGLCPCRDRVPARPAGAAGIGRVQLRGLRPADDRVLRRADRHSLSHRGDAPGHPLGRRRARADHRDQPGGSAVRRGQYLRRPVGGAAGDPALPGRADALAIVLRDDRGHGRRRRHDPGGLCGDGRAHRLPGRRRLHVRAGRYRHGQDHLARPARYRVRPGCRDDRPAPGRPRRQYPDGRRRRARRPACWSPSPSPRCCWPSWR